MAFAYGFSIDRIGVDYTLVDTTPRHAVGATSRDSKGRTWVYVKSNGVIGAFKMVQSAVASDPFTNVLIGTASAAATLVVGITPKALAAGSYAWIVSRGMVEDDAALISANLVNGQPVVCSAAGTADLAAATDINNAVGVCVVDDTDNTGSVYLY